VTSLAMAPVNIEADESTYAQAARTLFKWSTMCIATLDPQQRIVDASAEFLRRFGGTQASRAGQDFHELLHPGTRDKLRRKFQRALEDNRTTFDASIVGLGPRDSVFSGDITGFLNRGDTHRVQGIVVIVEPDESAEANPTPAFAAKYRVLTDVDAQILEGVAAGASTIQLASRLHLSRQGIEYRISSMFRKLNASNRAALVSRAYAVGALAVGCWPPRVKSDFVISGNSKAS